MIDGASKKNNFQKKVYQKIFVEEICYFQEQTSVEFALHPGHFQWKIHEDWKSRTSISIGFPLEISQILKEIPQFYALGNEISSRQINIF